MGEKCQLSLSKPGALVRIPLIEPVEINGMRKSYFK